MTSRLLSQPRNFSSQLIRLTVTQHGQTLEQRCTCSRCFHTSSANYRKKSGKKSKVLSFLSLVMQDGNVFRFMPALVKIDTGFHETPIHNYSYSGSKSRSSEFDLQLKLQLQDASSLQDIYDRLQVPTDQISAESAAYALQKICLLREEKIKGDHPESFISAAILNELYDTVSSGIDKISCSTLFMLLDCYFSFICWEESFGVAIEEEIEKRIGGQLFNFEELCTLSNILCRFKDSAECRDLLEKVWIHIQNRWKEISADSIAEIYTAVPNKYFRDVQTLLSSKLESLYWHLNSSDVRTILSELRTRKNRSLNELSLFGRWVEITFNQTPEEDMAYLVNSFMDLNYVDKRLLHVGSRYMFAKLQSGLLGLDLLLLFIQYSAFARFIDTKLLSAVSSHYVKHYKEYNHTQVQRLVSVFASLRYIPSNHTAFFSKLESHLYEEAYDMDCTVLMGIITDIMMLWKIPFNLHDCVFNYRFFSKVHDLRGNKYDRVEAQIFHFRSPLRFVGMKETWMHTLLKQNPNVPRQVLYSRTHGPISAQCQNQLEIIVEKLRRVYGTDNVKKNVIRHFGIIDIAVLTDFTVPGKFSGNKLAILLCDKKSMGYINKPNHLIGEVRRSRYADTLRGRGYWVMMVQLEEIEYLPWDRIMEKDILTVLHSYVRWMPHTITMEKSLSKESYFVGK